jgi:hypothetical protein
MPVANRPPVNGFQLLFSEVAIFDSEAIWKNLRNEYVAVKITTTGQVKTLSTVCDAA